MFHILKNYDPYFIMQELCKFDYKINIIQNGLEQYMSFNINSKLFFIDDFQFSSFPLNSLVKSLRKNDFNYLSQQLDAEQDLVKQKGFLKFEKG